MQTKQNKTKINKKIQQQQQTNKETNNTKIKTNKQNGI